ncbi:MAG: hypothetical protein COW41_05790 [Deltaproteobacteria bacterium CG17_big_fil_post_rev_8_21_14_2_50_51_6]|nr:MAG: hypothetical protein COS92_03580 [Desulfobacterales bacterium CG07_land_8_20_14_0_80_52_14]PIW00306.1 MAG: hypothetical protein COW41_05790 [Deltaproteobacteria bacterium CG17_big_fil_post_rev_8_21_14_2_50_51_6]PJB37261.1 MAG: hypothetical protein CO107_05375 [Deltaproteobacteria bacterium CG_4_9_14_3_um_filter_51_14]
MRTKKVTREDIINSAKVVDEASKPVGRPKRGVELKLKSFNLPVDLIERIQQTADESFGKNASALAEKAFKEFLGKR